MSTGGANDIKKESDFLSSDAYKHNFEPTETQDEKDQRLYLDNELIYDGKVIETIYDLKQIVTSREILDKIDNELSFDDSHCIRSWWFVDRNIISTEESRKQLFDELKKEYDEANGFS